MKKRIDRQVSLSVIVIFLGALVACDSGDSPGASTDEVAEEGTDDGTQESEDSREEDLQQNEEGPRVVQTTAASSEEIGVLPEGVGIAAGEEAGSFSLQDSDDVSIVLEELLEDSAVMLVFYRGGWCPFCNFQIRELTESYGEFERRGVLPVAISVDRTEESARTNAAYEIPFPVLSDPDLVAHEAFNVTYQVPAEEVERLRNMGMDLEEHSGRTHHSVAIPAVFLIGADGVVRWAHANEEYRVRPTLEQLVSAIDETL
jgi:peroxiredoxin